MSLRFPETKLRGTMRDNQNPRHTFGHYRMINTDSHKNPLRQKLIMLLSSQRRIRPSEKLRKSKRPEDQSTYARKCGRLCLCVVEETGYKLQHGEWSIVVRVESRAWSSLFDHTQSMSLLGQGNDRHIYGWCLQTLSTQLRELEALTNASSLEIFGSLKGISSNYDYKEYGAKQPDIDPRPKVELDVHFHNFLKSKFTQAQRNAIIQSATSDGVTLIQGPPGTGKTYTLHALMNTNQLHHSNVHHRQLMSMVWHNMNLMRSSGSSLLPWTRTQQPLVRTTTSEGQGQSTDHRRSSVKWQGTWDCTTRMSSGQCMFSKLPTIVRWWSAANVSWLDIISWLSLDKV